MLGENAFAVIRKNSNSADDIGSFESTSSNLINLRGRFEKFKSEKMIYNGREAIIADFVFYCDIPEGVFINESMTAIINGKEYSIAFIENIAMQNTQYKMYLRVK